MYRKKMSRSKSKRNFKRGTRVKKKGNTSRKVMRGGIRF